MEKWMIVYVLLLEVWMDIFCFPWISREKFGQLVDRIGNFKFAEHAQFYLHEWGKRSLGELYFDEYGLYKRVHNYWRYELISLPIPQAEMLANIKSFDNIEIRHFDAKILNFLGRIGTLLAEYQINLLDISPDGLADLRTILFNLTPLLDGIRSMDCSDSTLPMVRQCLSREKFARLKVLRYFHFEEETARDGMVQANVDFVVSWLTHQPANGPKLCQVYLFENNGVFEQIVQAICQQFLAAPTQSTFAVNLLLSFWVPLEEFHLANGVGEELHGVWIGSKSAVDKKTFLITRHRHGANGAMELQEWIREMARRKSSRCLHLSQPTVGRIATARMNVPRVNVLEEVEQQPCSSKDVFGARFP